MNPAESDSANGFDGDANPDDDSPGSQRDCPTSVGYRRPPAHSRFKPGVSGNPRGRPKGAKNVETLSRDLLNRQVTITKGGSRRRVSLLEAILLAHSQRAIKGDAKAARLLIDLGRRVAETQPEDAAPTPEQDRAIIDEYFARYGGSGSQGEDHDGDAIAPVLETGEQEP